MKHSTPQTAEAQTTQKGEMAFLQISSKSNVSWELLLEIATYKQGSILALPQVAKGRLKPRDVCPKGNSMGSRENAHKQPPEGFTVFFDNCSSTEHIPANTLL